MNISLKNFTLCHFFLRTYQHLSYDHTFYRLDAVLALYLCVCPSVCLSEVTVLGKRLMIALGFTQTGHQIQVE